jgi:hypothetical protein
MHCIARKTLSFVPALATILLAGWPAAPASASVITSAALGPSAAITRLEIDGIQLVGNGVNAGAAVALNRPWVFMFAHGSLGPQDFKSNVAAPGGIATNAASSTGLLGSANSSATINGTTGAFAAFANTRGVASANALAGIGSTYVSAVPFTTALRMHLATLTIDPLSFPNVPVPQSPPPDADGFPPFDPAFVPSSLDIGAYLQDDLGEVYSLFHLTASLGYQSSTGRFDALNLQVTGPGGATSTLITPSDFTYFNGPDGSGWRLQDRNLEIPYSLASSFVGREFTAALEGLTDARSSVTAVPEPGSLKLCCVGLGGLLFCLRRARPWPCRRAD